MGEIEQVSPKFRSTDHGTFKSESNVELREELKDDGIFYSDSCVAGGYIPAAGVGIFN